jgi:hypothetical protein
MSAHTPAAAAAAAADLAAGAVVQFLEAAVHTVLRARSVYSPSLFESRRLYGIVVTQCRHPGVCGYVGTVLSNLQVRGRGGWQTSTCCCCCCCCSFIHAQCALSCMIVATCRHTQPRAATMAGVPTTPALTCVCVRGLPRVLQPLLRQDTLQELVVAFYEPSGSLNSKCSFIVQVRPRGHTARRGGATQPRTHARASHTAADTAAAGTLPLSCARASAPQRSRQTGRCWSRPSAQHS